MWISETVTLVWSGSSAKRNVNPHLRMRVPPVTEAGKKAAGMNSYPGPAWSLLAAALCSLHIQGEVTPPAPIHRPFIVGQGEQKVGFSFTGRAQVSRGDVKAIYPPCKRIVITGRIPDGSTVRKGDPILVFNADLIAQELPAKRMQLEVAEKELVLHELQLQDAMKKLREEKSQLEADLAVKEATILSERFKDRQQEALKKESFVLSQRDAELKQAQYRNQQELHELGEISRDRLIEARREAELANAKTIVPKIEWQLATDQIDLVAIEKLRLEVLQLQMKLGKDTEAVAQGARGIEARIQALEAKIRSKRKGLIDERNRAERDYHKTLRDSADHTPIRWIEILDSVGNLARKVHFHPKNSPAVSGHESDHGEVYTNDRGYGWDRPASEMMFTRKNRNGKPAPPLAVISGRAVWQHKLANGRYRIRIGIGDVHDWDGALVRDDTQALFHQRRLKENEQKIVETESAVTDGLLRLTFGSDETKALRATQDGVVSMNEWLKIGRGINWTEWPMGFESSAKKFTIKARVHQAWSDLLRQAPAVAPKESNESPPSEPKHERPTNSAAIIARVRAELATSEVRFTRPNGEVISTKVVKIGKQPVTLFQGLVSWWERKEDHAKDRIAREVILKPAPEDAERLRLNEMLRGRCELTLPAGTFAIPVHLLEAKDDRFYVKAKAGGRKEIIGFRVGADFVAVSGLHSGQRLLPHQRIARKDNGENSIFFGEVIPGERTSVTMDGWGWGRIKELVPDGSNVEEDQIVVRLSNKWLETRKEELEQEHIKANQEFMDAAKERRVKGVQASLEHREKSVTEKLARNKVRAAIEIQPLELARKENEYKTSKLQASYKVDRFQLLQKLGMDWKVKIAPASHGSALSQAQRQKKYLEYVTALRSRDWVALIEARAEWMDAVEGLGLREGAMKLARLEEHVARMKARLKLEHALRGDGWEQRFDKVKDLRARSSGRLFYLKGWNDHTNKVTVIQKDFQVWGGLPIAEVLDMAKLSFKAELPEELYHQIEPGKKLAIEFEQFNHRKVAGTVTERGRRFFVPEDALQEDFGQQAISSNRVFEVSLNFSPPEDMQKMLTPGTKGRLHVE